MSEVVRMSFPEAEARRLWAESKQGAEPVIVLGQPLIPTAHPVRGKFGTAAIEFVIARKARGVQQ
jgi:hypothetical protein